MDVVAFDLANLQLRERYDRLFESCPSAFIQQSTYWAEVIQDLGPDRPIFLLCRDGQEDVGGLPLYLTKHALGNILTSVPQPGPLGGLFVADHLSQERKAAVYRVLLREAQRLAEENECLALTVISNPFNNDLPLYEEVLQPNLVFENFTQYLRLTEPARRSGGQKNNLIRARKFGFIVQELRTEEELESWHDIHCQRQVENGAAGIDFRMFEKIAKILVPRDKAWMLLAKDGEKIAAGCVYVYHRHVLDVFAISMDSTYAPHAPNALLADHSQSLAASRGILYYNWQSSPSRSSGVYQHKKMWGSQESPYYFTTRLFCEPARFRQIGLQRLRSEYPGRYVVPFAAFDQGFEQKMYRKA